MTLKTPEQIANQLEDLGARLPLGVVIPEEAAGALRGTLLAMAAEAWREGYQAGYENGYDGLYGRAENPYD